MTPPSSTASRHQGGPAERYGTRRTWTRPAVMLLAAVLAVAGGGWLAWAGLHHATPAVEARVEGFEVTSPGEVRVTLFIERDADTAVGCLIMAQARDHAVVGEREVVVPAGTQTAFTRTFVVRTEREATTGVLDHCRPLETTGARS